MPSKNGKKIPDKKMPGVETTPLPNELNATIDSDKPVNLEGEKKVVIQELQIRQAIRTLLDVEAVRTAYKNADLRVLPNRTRLYDICEDCLIDGHLSGIIDKRIDAVVNKPLYFEKDGEKVEELDPLINSIDFYNLRKEILWTKMWGITGFEFVPGTKFRWRSIPRKHIKPHWQRITIEQNGTEGFDYTQIPSVWVIGEPRDLGLLSKCATYVVYKRNNVADWAQYIEIFGQPIREIRYENYDEQARLTLKKMLDEIGSSLSLLIPKTAELKVHDGKISNGDGGLQEKFKDSMNAEMSLLILGNTETSHSSKGSGYAQSKTHQQQQMEITKSDIVYQEFMLNDPQFLSILADYGYPVEGGKFAITRDIDIEFLKERIQIDKQLAELIPIPQDYFYDTYGVPQPEDGQEATDPENYDENVNNDPPEDDPENGGDSGKKGPKGNNPPADKKKAGKSKKNSKQAEDLADQVIRIMQNKLGADFFE
jgi:hypothetical protein